MNINEFTDLLQQAKIVSSNLFLNQIYIDGTVYNLHDAVTESSYQPFTIKSVHDLKIYNFSLNGAKDKDSKKVMTHRFSLRFNDSTKGITFEYNSDAKFTVNEETTANYKDQLKSVTGCYSYDKSTSELKLLETYFTSNSDEQLTKDAYNAKYKSDEPIA